MAGNVQIHSYCPEILTSNFSVELSEAVNGRNSSHPAQPPCFPDPVALLKQASMQVLGEPDCEVEIAKNVVEVLVPSSNGVKVAMSTVEVAAETDTNVLSKAGRRTRIMDQELPGGNRVRETCMRRVLVNIRP